MMMLDVFLIFHHIMQILSAKKESSVLVFNRYIPVFSTVFNNRDHRKILVIDGNAAFTGGINFADEYINESRDLVTGKIMECE